jgi:hypothetical protein
LTITVEGKSCKKCPTGFIWLGQKPRQVFVRWIANELVRECAVPLVDEFGRIAATALPQLDLDEAWWQLANFPMPPEDEEISEYDDTKTRTKQEKSPRVPVLNLRYPIRQMMELVENIAAKQTGISEADWITWCTRLEQTLMQASSSHVVQYFLDLKLNPLHPLRELPFRPAFAETSDTTEGARYEELLSRIEKAWGVIKMPKIGAVI